MAILGETMSHRRVLILQNLIGRDGRSRIIGELVPLLNRYGVVPEIATLSGRDHVKAFFDDQRGGGRLRIRRYWCPTGRGYLAQVLLLNALSRGMAAKADLIINLNDNFHFLRPGPRYLHFICDPIEEMFRKADQLRLRPWTVYVRACQAVARLAPTHTEGIVLVISAFTRERLSGVHPDVAIRAHVVFPPCFALDQITSGQSRKIYDVVNVGTFSAGKGQLEALRLADRNRDLRFVLVGSVSDRAYVRRCLDFKRDRRLNNVEIVLNAERRHLEELLEMSRIYLHMKADEGFGISTVEATVRGCIPLVPDSGGQREVVPLPALRYIPGADTEESLRRLVSLDEETQRGYIAALRAHVMQFSIEAFRRRMEEFLLPLIETAREASCSRVVRASLESGADHTI